MFDDLHDPTPPTPGLDTLARVSARAKAIRRRRVALASGASVAAVALVAAAIVLPGRDRSTIAPADTVSTSVPEPAPTSAPSTADAETADTTAMPSTTTAGRDACRDLPAPPPWLLDGSSPGEAAVVTAADGSMSARWGVDGSDASVFQVAPDPAAGWFGIVEGTDQLVVAGRVRAAVVPIGDGAFGEIRIAVSDESCDREYVVGPGVEIDTATAFAQDWVDALDAWNSLTVSETFDSRCVAIGATRTSSCASTDAVSPGGNVSVEPLMGTSLSVVMAVGADGSALTVPSSRARTTSIPGTENVLLIDIVRDVDCAGVSFPDGTTTPIGSTCSDEGVDALASDAPIVAIDVNGDAVVFREPGVPTVVFDGADPDDLVPPEDTVAYVDGVAATADGSTTFMGVCCEPSAGAIWRDDASGGEAPFLTYGHLPALTSYGNLVWSSFGPVNIGGLDGSVATTLLDLDPNEWTVTDLAVVQRGSEPEEVLVLASRNDGTYLWRVFVGGGDMQLSRRISGATAPEAEISLAGFTPDAFLVLDRSSGRVDQFDASTLEPTAVGSVTVDWISAWTTPSGERYVDGAGVLWVDGASWGGDYRWVR